MSAVIDQLVHHVKDGIVILDSSPVLAVADSLALATKVDACLVVIDSSKTRVALARRAISSLQRVRASVIGAVLNKLPTSEAKYYQHGYYGQDVSGTEAAEGRRA
jgi:Mrp family chromosome partitioning ATPase